MKASGILCIGLFACASAPPPRGAAAPRAAESAVVFAEPPVSRPPVSKPRAHERSATFQESTPAASRPASSEPASEEPAWKVSATALYYAIPGASDTTTPIVTVDRGALHLEARYNYEARDTGSLWAGWNFGVGEELRFDATLMGGVVGGQIQGGAAGFRANLKWRFLEAYTEGEQVVSIQDRHDNFFYSWSELSAYPLDWLRLGVVGQRTRLYSSNRQIDRGPLLGVNFDRFSLTGYVIDPDDAPVYIISFGVSF